MKFINAAWYSITALLVVWGANSGAFSADAALIACTVLYVAYQLEPKPKKTTSPRRRGAEDE